MSDNKEFLKLGILLVFVIIAGLVAINNKPSTTGLVTAPITENLGAVLKESDAITITLKEVPKAFSITGAITGGDAEIHLIDGEKNYRILDSRNIEESNGVKRFSEYCDQTCFFDGKNRELSLIAITKNAIVSIQKITYSSEKNPTINNNQADHQTSDQTIKTENIKAEWKNKKGISKVNLRADNKFDAEMTDLNFFVEPGTASEIRATLRGLTNDVNALYGIDKNYRSTTDLFGLEPVQIESAVITIPKKGTVSYIQECADFNWQTERCNSWRKTGIPFTENADSITFRVDHAAVYSGGRDGFRVRDKEGRDVNVVIRTQHNSLGIESTRLTIIPQNSLIKSIELIDYDSSSGGSLGIEDAITLPMYTEVYAIDPTTINFTSAVVTVTAAGNVLYKCPSWNFAENACAENNWIRMMDIVPGENYSFILTQNDPAFGEMQTPGANGTDTYIDSSFAANSFGNDVGIKVGRNTNTKRYRGLFFYNISAIPSNAIVTNASLRLYLSGASSATSYAVNAHRLTRSWTNNATWNNYDGTSAWTVAGGDYDSAAYSSVNIGNTVGYYTWNLTKLAQEFVNGTNVNFGILLKTAETGNNEDKTFNSSNSANAALRPRFEINWSVAPTIFSVSAINITETDAVIKWSTNEASNSTVGYGISPDEGTTMGDVMAVTQHIITLSGLIPATVYYYNLTSCNGLSQCSQSGTYNFTTPATNTCNYSGGNWMITGIVYCNNQTLVINGNINITGNAIFSNTTIKMNNPTNGQFNMFVNNGGTLKIVNGTIIDKQGTASYYLQANPGSSFTVLDSTIRNAGYQSGINEYGYNDGTSIMVFSDNALIDNATLQNNYIGIKFKNAANATIRNSVIQNSANNDGVVLYNSSECKIYNNKFRSNKWNIEAYPGSNCQVYNNDIVGGEEGIDVWSHAVNIFGNNITNTTYVGIWTNYTQYTNITGNIITGVSGQASFDGSGIELDYSNYNTISNNKISGVRDYGVWILGGHNNTIKNVSISGGISDFALYLTDGTSDNNLSDIQMHNNPKGIYSNSRRNDFTRIIVNTTNSAGSDGIILVGSSNITISNSRFINILDYDVDISQNAQLTLTNTTFRKTSTKITNSALITSRWFADVFVNDSSGAPIPTASVSIADLYGTNAANTVTNSSGWTPSQTLTEYVQNSGTRMYYTNHTFTANKTGWQIKSVSKNINQSANVVITFGTGDSISPALTFIGPTPANNSKIGKQQFIINVSSIETNPDIMQLFVDGSFYEQKPYSGSLTAFNVTLSNGTHTFRVAANDTFGNQNSTETRSVNIDVYGPEIYNISFPATVMLGGEAVITASSFDSSNVSAVILEIDNSQNITMTPSIGYQFVTTLSNLLFGQHSFRIAANDSFNNRNTSTTQLFSVIRNDSSPTFIKVIQPAPKNSSDSYIDENNPGMNYGSNSFLYVGVDGFCMTSTSNCNNTGRLRSLISFDLSDINPDEQIQNAILSLKVINATSSKSQIIEVRSVNESWSDLGVTWIASDYDYNWTTPGGTYSVIEAETNVSISNVSAFWNITNLVQKWVSNWQQNYGIILKYKNESATSNVTKKPGCHGEEDGDIVICHRTNSNVNPYVLIRVDEHAIDGNGNDDHTHHLPDKNHPRGDIIPAYDANQNGVIDIDDCLALPDIDGELDNNNWWNWWDDKNHNKTLICHRTNAETNPYVIINVAKSSIDGQGANDHTRHLADTQHNRGDIIPITDRNNDGRIDVDDCMVPPEGCGPDSVPATDKKKFASGEYGQPLDRPALILQINDVKPPTCKIKPMPNGMFYDDDIVEIAATATDQTGISVAFTTITYPNSTLRNLTLNNIPSTDIYAQTFSIPNLSGLYNITCFVNDTANRINNTERTNFTAIRNPCITVTTNYQLTENLPNLFNKTCINIIGNNLTLDCNGFSVTGSGTGTAINVTDAANIMIKSCIINNYTTGINFNKVINSTIINNTIINSGTGINMGPGANNTIVNNYVNSSYFAGIWLNNGAGVNGVNLIVNNTLAINDKQIIIVNAPHNNITNTNFTGTIIFQNANGSIIFNGYINLTESLAIYKVVNIGYNNAYVNTTLYPYLNLPGNITLFNLEGDNRETLISHNNINFMPCPENTCTIISYANGSLAFNVTNSWGNFSSQTTAQIPGALKKALLSTGVHYEPGDIIRTAVACLDEQNHFIPTSANLTFYYPNNSIFVLNKSLTSIGTGLFAYNLTAPNVTGVYIVTATCYYGSRYANTIATFIVQPPTSIIPHVNISTNITANFTVNLTPVMENINLTREGLTRLLERAYAFSQEEIYLITDALNSVAKIGDDLNTGKITPVEAEIRLQKAKNTLAKFMDRSPEVTKEAILQELDVTKALLRRISGYNLNPDEKKVIDELYYNVNRIETALKEGRMTPEEAALALEDIRKALEPITGAAIGRVDDGLTAPVFEFLSILIIIITAVMILKKKRT